MPIPISERQSSSEPFWQTTDGETFRVWQGSVQQVAPRLPEGQVQMVMTSPPYWNLRDYKAGVEEIGREKTLDQFLDNVCDCFDALIPCLAPTAVVVVNLGDTFGGKRGKYLVPAQFALEMQRRGWTLTDEVIWAKAFSGKYTRGGTMPESITGWRWERCRIRSWPDAEVNKNPELYRHNQRGRKFGTPVVTPCPGCEKCEPNGGYVLRRGKWRHTNAFEMVYVFSRGGYYFADQEAVREESQMRFGDTQVQSATGGTQATTGGTQARGSDGTRNPRNVLHEPLDEELLWQQFVEYQRNSRNVQHVNTQPYAGAHFATYPEELVRHYVKAYTSEKGCCPHCRSPWARIVESKQLKRERPNDKTSRHSEGLGVNSCGNTVAGVQSTTVGWAPTCDCKEHEPVPCVVLDPFLGSGTTAAVAFQEGQSGWGIELSKKYLRENAIPRLEGQLLDRRRAELIPGRSTEKVQFGRNVEN